MSFGQIQLDVRKSQVRVPRLPRFVLREVEVSRSPGDLQTERAQPEVRGQTRLLNPLRRVRNSRTVSAVERYHLLEVSEDVIARGVFFHQRQTRINALLPAPWFRIGTQNRQTNSVPMQTIYSVNNLLQI